MYLQEMDWTCSDISGFQESFIWRCNIFVLYELFNVKSLKKKASLYSDFLKSNERNIKIIPQNSYLELLEWFLLF